MKELVVVSGKGGTGKTSLTAAFAALAKNSVLCDADVDAADLHLLAKPEILQTSDFQGGNTALINPEKCSQCGLCREMCRFSAIGEDLVVDSISCEGCGVCVFLCPEKAIDFPINTCGQWFISDTRFGPMVHARLGIAEENSGKLVTLVRREAKKVAEKQDMSLMITDGPPGIGCPVIASIGGASAVLVVAEPTVSGVHDMQRVAKLAAHFKVPVMVCINKADLNPDQAKRIEEIAATHGMSFVGAVSFDPVFVESMVAGQTIFEYAQNSAAGNQVKQIWQEIKIRLNEN